MTKRVKNRAEYKNVFDKNTQLVVLGSGWAISGNLGAVYKLQNTFEGVEGSIMLGRKVKGIGAFYREEGF